MLRGRSRFPNRMQGITGNFLSSVALSDVAVKGSSGAYISGFNMSIPSGDFCIGMATLVPATASTDFVLMSLGTASDTIVTDTGALVIGWPGNGSNTGFNRGFAVTGKDDSANTLSDRLVTVFGASTRILTGPQLDSGTPDAVIRHIFFQRSGTEVQFWMVEPGTSAIKYNAYTSSFGAISSKAVVLGALNKLAVANTTAVSYQRFFRIARALTRQQMEAYAAGVDPRQFLTFSAGSGDILFAFDQAATTGRTYTDLIQGLTATCAGTWTTATALLPTSVVTDEARIDLPRYKIFQATGSSSDLTLSGTCTGQDGIIEIQIINDPSNSGATYLDWTPIARSSQGIWSGTLTGLVPRNSTLWYDIQVRKKINGAVTGSTTRLRKKFALGAVMEMLGQSLMAQMRITGTGPAVAPSTIYSFYSRSLQNNSNLQGSFALNWSKRLQSGYGEGNLVKALTDSTLLNYPAGVLIDAVSGSSIANWINDSNSMWTNALASMRENKPRYIFWHQGENSLGDGYSGHKTNLTSLYNIMKAAIDWTWYFIVIPLDNTFLTTASATQYYDIRRAQVDWVNEQIAAGETRVLLGCTVTDIPFADTNADGIHKTATAGGYGRYAERMAETVAFLEGVKSYSGMGPKIVSATWNAATIVDVTVQHNGGTNLQVPNAADVTGFEASINGFSSNLTISSAVIQNSTTIRLTLSATPASAPAIRYQWGRPGTGTTDAANGLSNPVYDNRTPWLNTTLGFPLMFTPSNIQST